MKTLILAASFALFAAPAFAADTSAPQQTAMDTNAQQKHTYSVMSEDGARGAIAQRQARLRQNELERSNNAKAAYAGAAHYY